MNKGALKFWRNPRLLLWNLLGMAKGWEQQRTTFKTKSVNRGYHPQTAKSLKSKSYSHGLIINSTPKHVCFSFKGLQKLILNDCQGQDAFVLGPSAAVRKPPLAATGLALKPSSSPGTMHLDHHVSPDAFQAPSC